MIAIGALEHFFFSCGDTPAVVDNTIHSNHNPRAISAMVAMDKYRPLLLCLANTLEHLSDVLGGDTPSK